MCEHAPPEPLSLQPSTVLRAALENKKLCARCRMQVTSELLVRQQAGVDDDADDERG